ncbi:regulator of G-protein signaling 7-like [Parasteatoda tepidariorum]|uniref:regulator of G-protein signaling 7-like n=1 Tax=Parasteatoda tepidariorum TaxID=114398 RepID=UPI001C729474|nr:regulator of G-protein signaling 7-like [Parasteatoda tepidariorum]
MHSEEGTATKKNKHNKKSVRGTNDNNATPSPEEGPNFIVYKKMERIVERMQDECRGVPVRTVKSFMSKVPSVFTGSDLITWMMRYLEIDDQVEALHLAHQMSAHGYFFPIDDHLLTVKADGTFYRFQTPYFWPSNCWEPENTDYAVYLCKRTMQNKTRLELVDYEAENLARLQKMFSRKWEFIFMQAEAQAKCVAFECQMKNVFFSFQPGTVNTTEIDLKKAFKANLPSKHSKQFIPQTEAEATNQIDHLRRQVKALRNKIDRGNVKTSKVCESYVHYFEQYVEYDSFLTSPEYSNPWISDSTEAWEMEKQTKEVSVRRVKKWAFSLQELLKDPAGREQFYKFLDKEFSAENLKFYDAVQELKQVNAADVESKVKEIWNEFLEDDANTPVNIDSQSFANTKKNVEEPDRWVFDEAASHLYLLMKNDSYARYLRSDLYKEYLNGTKKKSKLFIPKLPSLSIGS